VILPPSLPDLNLFYFSFWAQIEKKACDRQHPNFDSLKQAVTQAWAKMSAKYIQKTWARFRPQVEAIIAKNGGYIN